ncbi:MAG: DUF1003 domain-containing protein [Candidatus Promineifilaceae bacterium]|nr:DUF1003 domain-containing protein [Candidatus Promineifilaceae bacterium]
MNEQVIITGEEPFNCPSCGEERDSDQLWHGFLVPETITDAIHAQHPNWRPELPVCLTCVHKGKAAYMRDMLEEEMGSLTDMDLEVLDSISHDSLITPLSEGMDVQEESLRLPGRITKAIASWYFLLIVLLLLLLWVSVNVLLRPLEPFPVVMLAVISAVLATLAALEAPIIMMSQRRQNQMDRRRARNQYQVNLKAELEIRILDQKTDLMLLRQKELLDKC